MSLWFFFIAQLEAVVDAEWMSYLVVSLDGKLLAGVAGDPHTQDIQIKVWRRR